MLILNRRVNEALIIDGDIRVAILGVSRGQIRIGIDAPKQISVHREEVHERIQQETINELEESECNAIQVTV